MAAMDIMVVANRIAVIAITVRIIITIAHIITADITIVDMIAIDGKIVL